MFAAVSAYSSGVWDGHQAETIANLKATYAVTGLTSTQREHLAEVFGEKLAVAPIPDFSGKPIKAYVDGVTYFYSSHPDAANMDLGFILKCIQNHPTDTCDKVASDYAKVYRKP